MAKLITVFWRDIPAQVIGREGRKNIKKQLPTRFAEAIDRAAMRAGAASSEAYLSDWRRESRSCKSDIGKIVDDEVSKLESAFPDSLLELVIKSGGILEKEEIQPNSET